MYLDRILGTKTKINVLAALFTNDKKSTSEKELASMAGVSFSELNRQSVDLINSGLVVVQRSGKTKLYSLNRKHFLYGILRRLFRDLDKVYRDMASEIAKHVSKKYKVKCVILIGSVRRKKVSQDYIERPSDLDIVIVGEDIKKDELLEFITYKLFDKYGVNCYPIILSEKEYRKRVKEGDPFMLEVHTEGEVLYGKKPKRII
ncbi:MAG: hypothetical protein J7K68_03660 [Candidatus Diapherotrites archaeon]|nr:hypothetical protein [Candidatus Diapherotrites archaeon]